METICDGSTSLGVDTACVNVTSKLEYTSWLYALQSNCHLCPYTLLDKIEAEDALTMDLNTHHSWSFRVTDSYAGEYLSASNTSFTLCDISWRLGQDGNYGMIIRESVNNNTECATSILKPPVNIYIPLILAISILVIISFVYKMSTVVITRIAQRKKVGVSLEMDQEMKVSDGEQTKKRVASLDTFRGISILLMIFVNDGAGGYSVLEHADWDGLHLADVLFPWFLWIMGVCIPISVKSQIKRFSRLAIIKTIFKRSVILFSLGVMLNTLGVGPQLETLRIFGILQRFGVLYLIVAGSCALLWPRNTTDQGTPFMRDVTTLLPQWILHLLLHAAHLAIIFLLPVPDCPSGYLGPGGRSQDGLYYNCTGGATGYIDRVILGEEHLYQNPTSKLVYGSGPFDPEGPYGCLPSLLTVMLGVQAGTTLLTFPAWKARARRWAAWGCICLVLATPILLANTIPVNKNLWSTTFVLITSGLAFLLLTFCYVLIDVVRCWSGSPFLYPGMNATVMYVGHMVAYQLWPFHWRYGNMDSHAWLLVEAVWGVAAWTYVAIRLYKNKFFLSI